jgi:hypothetical protein
LLLFRLPAVDWCEECFHPLRFHQQNFCVTQQYHPVLNCKTLWGPLLCGVVQQLRNQMSACKSSSSCVALLVLGALIMSTKP